MARFLFGLNDDSRPELPRDVSPDEAWQRTMHSHLDTAMQEAGPLELFPPASDDPASQGSGPTTRADAAAEAPSPPPPPEVRSRELTAEPEGDRRSHAGAESVPPVAIRLPDRLQISRTAVIILTAIALAEGGCIAYRFMTGRSVWPSSVSPVVEAQRD